MRLKGSCTFVFVVCLIVIEARVPKLRLDPNLKIRDPNRAAKINDRIEEDINNKWSTLALEDENDETIFQASSFNDSSIRGKIMYTIQNKEIYAYQGFRFGKAERFLPPEDIDKFWEGDIFNATHIGLKCPQGAYVGHQRAGDEDCLFLNVYTPYNPDIAIEKMAVMVFVYGGSFTSGDASLYMPTKLLDHDVILVTIHYRLGAFGFYTRDSRKAPGNLAFYDQISALRWVQRHIDDFGGDSTKVTVFGESAGSVSVNYMMLLTNNEDENLIRGVIAESGSALDHWALDLEPSYATNFYESYVGCNYTQEENETDDEFEDRVLDCMRGIPFQKLIDAGKELVRSDRQSGYLGFRGCSPTLQTFDDTELTEFKKILYQEPRDYFVNGDFRDTAFMTGSNREEGSFVIGIMYHDYLVPNNLANNTAFLREELFRTLLLSIGVKDETESLAKSMQKEYCDGVDMADLETSQYCLIDLAGIMFLKAGSWQMCNYHSYYSVMYNASTYYYSFEFESDDSMGDWVISSDSPFYTGITHADELMYIFAMPAVLDDFPNQWDVSQRMTLLWTNFAKYLDPTPDFDTAWQTLNIPKWLPYKFEEPHFMRIDAEFELLDDYQDRWGITWNQHKTQPVKSTTEAATKTKTTTPKPNSSKIPPTVTGITEPPITGTIKTEPPNTGSTISEPPKPTTNAPPTVVGSSTTEEPCTGLCAEYKEQRDAFMITMIVFIVAFFILCLEACYLYYKLRQKKSKNKDLNQNK